MHYVKSRDNRTGITYVYESESYWDKEKQQPRARRKLVGRLDEETGEIVPTGKPGRKRKSPAPDAAAGSAADASGSPSEEAARIKELSLEIWEKDAQIRKLAAQNEKLLQERDAFIKALNALVSGYSQEA